MQASWIAAAAPLVFLVFSTAATLAAQNYSSLQSPISALAESTQPHSWIINTGFITYGLMVQGLGFVLYASTDRRSFQLLLSSLVILYGSGGIAAGIFVTGETNIVAFGLTEGDLHGASSWITLSAVLVLMAAGAFVQPLGGGSSAIRKVSLAMLVLTLAAVIQFSVTPSGMAPSGLFQRGFFATTMLWVFVSSLHLGRRLHKRQQEGLYPSAHLG
jgi:hypothetical membrane protein